MHFNQLFSKTAEIETSISVKCYPIFTNCSQVFSIEPRGPPQEAPKRYEYRSFAEALKIPMLGSAFYAIRKLYWMVRSSCFLFFCVLTVWETVVVSIARIANAIFWFRLFLILVDSTIFRVIVCLRQRYPVLGTEYSEVRWTLNSLICTAPQLMV